MRSTCNRLTIVVLAALALPRLARGEFTIDLAHPTANSPKEAVLFPFDNHAIPLRRGLEMNLLLSDATRASYNPVLVRGKPGAPDSARIGYYGTVIEKDGKFHMWYIGDGDRDKIDQDFSSTPYLHILYAVSEDGLHWEKPNLGLVEYNGNKDNNLVQTNVDSFYRSCTVLYDPEDPDAERRYKLYYEGKPDSRGCALFSRDGLTWHPASTNPLTPGLFEQTGLIKRDGMYFVVGQAGSTNGGFRHRTLVEFMSPDFEHWTDTVVLGFRRDQLPPRQGAWANNMGPQVHLGAGFWDRGNVLIGLYGQWNGDPTDSDRRYMKMNLGLILTHDGMHFQEPIPDFKMIKSEEENWMLDTMGSSPRITQGQGFVNHDNKTITYYGHWGKDGNKEIRAAVWERDRLGQYAVNRNPIEGQKPATRGALQAPDPSAKLPCFVTCPIVLPEGGGQVFLNCGNLSRDSELRVSVVDRQFKPIEGCSLAECEPVQTDGYRVAVRWKGGDRINAKGPIRLRVQWGGVVFDDPIVYTVYVAP